LSGRKRFKQWGLTGIMSGDIISFQSEVEKRHVPDVVAATMVDPPEPSDHQYVIELEHENMELRNLLADAILLALKHRARPAKPIRLSVAARPVKRRT
jgi:hypothetical protein